MMSLPRSLFTGMLLLYMQAIHAQPSKPPATVQSPNISSLGLFGEMPVSPFAGLVNVNIPLYEFTDRAISIPISLNYHASGFRPDMHPGWVGMGWTLNCGGVITRTIKDAPDEFNNANILYGYQAGFYWTHNILNAANWDQIPYMKTVAQSNANSAKDTEPDIFSFSYPGGSGSFYLDHLGNWKVKCDKPVKVSFNNQFLGVPFPKPDYTFMSVHGDYPSFSGFTITDENGHQYIFGGNTNAIEYEIDFFRQDIDTWKAQCWYLTKIIHPDGYEVTLNYEKDDFVNQMYTNIILNMGKKAVDRGTLVYTSCSSIDQLLGANSYYSGKLVSPSYLTSIVGGNATVFFDRSTSTELRYPDATYYEEKLRYNALQQPYSYPKFLPSLCTNLYDEYPSCLNKLQWKQLDKIRVMNNNPSIDIIPLLKKSFNFAYSSNANQRLTLLSILEKGTYGESKSPYVFSYDSSLTLPPYLAYKTDHWGFYNGTATDFSSRDNLKTTYYASRNPNSTYLMTGILNKIAYPTGGVTEFIYEPHQYSKRLRESRSEGLDATFSSNTLGGGLRIKKVISYDTLTPANKKIKEYFYVNGYTNTANTNTLLSSGILGGQPKYYYDDYKVNSYTNSNAYYSLSIFSSQSVLPASDNNAGTHIGYSEVTEKLLDGSYTRYFFTNFDNGHIDEPGICLQMSRTAYEPVGSLASERGVLLREEHYNSSNVLVQKKALQYEALNKSNEFVRSMSATHFTTCTNDEVEQGVSYKIYTYSYVPKTEITTTYDENGGNPMTTQRDLTYHTSYRQVSKETVENSKAESISTYYRYPYDILSYTPAANATANEATAFMLQHNMIGSPIEVLSTKMKGETEWVVNSKATEYKSVAGKIKPVMDYQFESAAPIAKSGYVNYTVTGYTTTENINKDSRLQPALQYLKYNDEGSIVSYARRNDKTRGILWGYADNYVLAEVDNAGTGQFAYTSFETNDFNGWSGGGTKNLYARNITGIRSYSGSLFLNITTPGTYMITLWAHSSGTPTVNGQAGTTMKVSGNMQLKQWKLALNPGEITVIGDYIDELRLYPENAQMTTYTYDPLVGLTSKCDVNNEIENYEYDGLGRLEIVRDREKNLLRKISYGYRLANPDTTYYSRLSKQTYTRQCFSLGSAVDYVVPAGKYTSLVSQQDADDRALEDQEQNGQNYANINGTCDDSPINLKYVTYLTDPITVTCENLLTHVTYTFSIHQATQTSTVFGAVPKGRYNVTFSIPGTLSHSVGCGLTWKSGTGTISFPNVNILEILDTLMIIN